MLYYPFHPLVDLLLTMPYAGMRHAGYNTGGYGQFLSNVDAQQDTTINRGSTPTVRLPNQFFTGGFSDDSTWQPTTFGTSKK